MCDLENNTFSRPNIEKLDASVVTMVDSDKENNIDMFCYVKCSSTDNDLIKQCRGVVFNGEKLVMKAFPYTLEYNCDETEMINTSLVDFKNWNFYQSHEGALVRMFYFNNKWFLSTHKKLNAFKSKWSSGESFGTMFKNGLISQLNDNEKFKSGLPDGVNILERFQSTLDVNKQYMFLIRNNNDNRIVCEAPYKDTVYHVGTFVDGKLDLSDVGINIPYPTKICFSNIEEMTEYVRNISYKNIQGIIGFNKESVIKILNHAYQELFKVRGNEPSLKFRYLQVRMDKTYTNMLYSLYPDMCKLFDEYENILYSIGKTIYNAYVQRFIKKCYVIVPREDFSIIRECHSWHLSDRANRVSLDKVIQVMNQQTPTRLNHMIRRFKLEKLQNEKNMII